MQRSAWLRAAYRLRQRLVRELPPRAADCLVTAVSNWEQTHFPVQLHQRLSGLASESARLQLLGQTEAAVVPVVVRSQRLERAPLPRTQPPVPGLGGDP